MAPIIAMLHNLQNNRYHTILFLEHPFPGRSLGEEPVRYKSKGHHTPGFESREEAVNHAREVVKGEVTPYWGEPQFALSKDFPWDGSGVPAMVVFFAEVDGELTPAF